MGRAKTRKRSSGLYGWRILLVVIVSLPACQSRPLTIESETAAKRMPVQLFMRNRANMAMNVRVSISGSVVFEGAIEPGSIPEAISAGRIITVGSRAERLRVSDNTNSLVAERDVRIEDFAGIGSPLIDIVLDSRTIAISFMNGFSAK